jgi:hypothetical protein
LRIRKRGPVDGGAALNIGARGASTELPAEIAKEQLDVTKNKSKPAQNVCQNLPVILEQPEFNGYYAHSFYIILVKAHGYSL